MISVGQRLREERFKRDLTLEEVASATKIKESFLLAIEKGDYAALPSSTYIQGFVKNYAMYLGLSANEYVALFRREFNEREHMRVLPQGFSKEKDISRTRYRLGGAGMGVVAIFIVLFGYLLFQYRYTVINPPLDVESPKENQKVSQNITVSGTTDENATVFIDEFPVVVDADGKFSKQITAFPGKTVITVKVQNRFGRYTQIERHVNVQQE